MSTPAAGLGLVVVALVWGLDFLLSPRVLGQMGFGLFALIRFMAAYLLISVVYRREMRSITFKQVTRGILLGGLLFGLALCQGRAVLAGQGVSALAGQSLALLPIALLARPILQQRLSIAGGLCVLASGAGVLLLMPGWSPWGLAAMLLLALYVVLGAAFVRTGAPEHLVAVQLAFATLCALVTMGRELPGRVDLVSWAILLFGALVSTAGGLLVLTRALKRLRAATAGVILALPAALIAAVLGAAGALPVSAMSRPGIGLVGAAALAAVVASAREKA